MELATDENTLFAFVPIRRTVPITITRITASITAYSAMSCPSSLRHKRLTKSVILDSFELCARKTQFRTSGWNQSPVCSPSFADSGGLWETFFSPYLPYLPFALLTIESPQGRSRGKARIFDGGVRPEQEDRLRVAEYSMPSGVEKEGLR